MSKIHIRGDSSRCVRAVSGRSYRITQILFAQWLPGQEGERCKALVHKIGWDEFSGRAALLIPTRRFRHCTSKFEPHLEGAQA
jgi:hypothetical protein